MAEFLIPPGCAGRTDRDLAAAGEECVNGMAHANGIEPLRTLLKRGRRDTCRHFNVKHAGRHAAKLAGPHNRRSPDAEQQMRVAAQNASCKRLPHKELAA